MKNGNSVKNKWSSLGIFILIAIIGGLLYLNILNAPFQWDDSVNIVRNRSLYFLDRPGDIFRFWPSRFVLFFSLACNYRWGGLDVTGYHAVNIVIHIFSAFLVYLIFLSLRPRSPSRTPETILLERRLAFLASLIFLVHPLQTQAVTYIIQRGASLSGFFLLLSFYWFIKSRRQGSALFYGGAWLAGLLGMFSKEGAAVLPLIIIIWDLFFGPRQRFFGKLKLWLPFFLIPLILLTVMVTIPRAGSADFYYSANLQSTPATLKMVDTDTPITSRWTYFLTQIDAVRTYVRLCFFPFRQSVYYDSRVTTDLFRPATFISAVFLFSLLIAGVRLLFRRSRAGFGIIFFFISLIPTSTLFVLWPLISEHHCYPGVAGFAWAAAGGAGLLLRRRGARLASGLIAGIVLCLALLCFSRNLVWTDTLTLWKDALEKAPHLGSLHAYVASAYMKAGRYDKVIEESKEAFRLDPDFDAYHNLWAAYHNRGEYGKAAAAARERIDKYPDSPHARLAYAITLIHSSDIPTARRMVEKALELEPDLPRAHFLMGRVMLKEGDLEGAAAEQRRALALAPHYLDAWKDLARVSEKDGNLEAATSAWRGYLRYEPSDARVRYNLAALYWRQKKWAEAKAQFRIILEMIDDPTITAEIDKYLKLLAEKTDL